jgi:AFG3 family protein
MQLFDQMCMTLGGRAAEALKFGEISTGATDDLQKVTRLAVAQVTEFGMNSKIGQLSFRRNDGGLSIEKPYSEQTHASIDNEVKKNCIITCDCLKFF